MIAGFDNLGFLVKYENGRLRVGPALEGGRAGKRELENEYYNSKADRTRRSQSGLVTVSRDFGGIQFEIEQLEFLINQKDIKENDLQKFFEENPHFLATHRQGTPIPHLRFPLGTDKLLIPDFLMRPNTAIQRDSNWEVLDLKLPSAKLITGKSARPTFSHEVAKAISQLQEYGDYFRNPNNKQVIVDVLAHHLQMPKLAVLIGRMPNDEDVEALELAQSRERNVKIITYDEILESQRYLLASG